MGVDGWLFGFAAIYSLSNAEKLVESILPSISIMSAKIVSTVGRSVKTYSGTYTDWSAIFLYELWADRLLDCRAFLYLL